MGGWDFQESGYYGSVKPPPPKAPPKEAAPPPPPPPAVVEYNITLGVIEASRLRYYGHN